MFPFLAKGIVLYVAEHVYKYTVHHLYVCLHVPMTMIDVFSTSIRAHARVLKLCSGPIHGFSPRMCASRAVRIWVPNVTGGPGDPDWGTLGGTLLRPVRMSNEESFRKMGGPRTDEKNSEEP